VTEIEIWMTREQAALPEGAGKEKRWHWVRNWHSVRFTGLQSQPPWSDLKVDGRPDMQWHWRERAFVTRERRKGA
jgi:hypothetical protein